MEKLKPISLVSHKKYESIILSDLKKVFEKVDLSKESYNESDFIYQIPTKESEMLLNHKFDTCFCIWNNSEKTIYFPDKYLELDEKVRISYFFHEICHFKIYNTIKESEKILNERQKINEEYKNTKISSGEPLLKYNHSYLLTFFNEQLTDNLMLNQNNELFSVKLQATTKEYKTRIKNAKSDISTSGICITLYSLIIDTSRSIELIKNKLVYREELRELHNLLEDTAKELKQKCEEEERFNLYMEYKNKLLSSYESKDASTTINTFNELIQGLIRL